MPTQCNEYAFHTINDDSAYWAGFLFADGCIHRQKKGQRRLRLELLLQHSDIEHLFMFREFVQTKKAIGRRERYLKRTNKIYKCCSIAIYSDILCNRLIQLGLCHQRIPLDELATNRNFWRGCVDGDGSIKVLHSNGYKNNRLSLLGTPLFLTKWITYVKSLYPNTLAKIDRNKCDHIHVTQIYGDCCRTVLRELYSDVNYVLMRKYIRAWSILNAPTI